MDIDQERTWALCAGTSGEGLLKITKKCDTLKNNITLINTLYDRCTIDSEPSTLKKLDSNKESSVVELQSSDSFELANGGNPVLGQHHSDIFVHGSLVSRANGSKLVMESTRASLSSKKFSFDSFCAPLPIATINRKSQQQVSESNARLTEESQGNSFHIR